MRRHLRQSKLVTIAIFVSSILLFYSRMALASWPAGGVSLNIATHGNPEQALTTDGNSGVIVAWTNFDNNYHFYRLFVQRVSAAGGLYWSNSGVPVTAIVGQQYDPAIASDGADGAYVAWSDMRGSSTDSRVFIQRFDGNGSPLWTTNGVPVLDILGQGSPQVVADGVGGCIVFWGSGLSLLAQRFSSDGVKQWTPNGISLCADCWTTGDLVAVSDGEGGAMLVWVDNELGFERVFAQRIMPSSDVVWLSNGVLLSESDNRKFVPKIVTDGDGGAFITWSEVYDSYDFRAMIQHVDRDGVQQWLPDGRRITDSALRQYSPTPVEDGLGGVIVAWQEDPPSRYVVLAQRLDHLGEKQWAPDGISVCTASGSQGRTSAHSDGNGGAIIMFLDQRTPTVSVAGQRLGPNGDRLWTDDGIVFGPGWLDNDYGPTAIADGAGGSLLVRQVATPTSRELYVHRVTSEGTTPTSVRVPSHSSLIVGSASPNPFSSTTFFDIDAREHSRIAVEVYDVTGTRVWDETFESAPRGPRRFSFDGRDDAGRLLPSGVYFYRVKAAGETVTRKMVIAR